MKTRLIEDFDESGSVPAGPAPRAAPPIHAQGFAPQPPGFVRAQGQDTTLPDPAAQPDARLPGRPRDTTDVNGDPEWLAALLARDAEELSESQSKGRWTRRVLTWGMATVVPVLLAAGGLWLYQENRVEGALIVVANTSPAPATAAAGTRPASPGIAATHAPAVPLTPVAAAVSETPPPEAAAAAETQDPTPSNADAIAPPRPKRSHVRKHPKAEATAGIPADSEPSARQRKEENLMQCRAHGYDDRQCVQRGCEMTRYGFACKG